MKTKRLTLLIMLLTLALGAHASAEAVLNARVEGGVLRVAWSAGGAQECSLTLLVDGWPMEIQRVRSSGSLERTAEAGKRYSARINTPNGCLTANATVEAPTREPTAIPTEKPVQVPTAIPTAAPTPVPIVGTNQGDLADQVVRQVNAERAKAGLGELRVDAELTRAARVRAGEIVEKFSHTRPDGTAWSTVSGSAFGENIAMGQSTADKVMAAWMSSQGHRENILRASYGSIGVAAYRYDGVMYWVQLFGK